MANSLILLFLPPPSPLPLHRWGRITTAISIDFDAFTGFFAGLMEDIKPLLTQGIFLLMFFTAIICAAPWWE